MPEVCNFSKRETLTQMFSCEFYEIFKNTFFTGHLRVHASVTCQDLLTPKFYGNQANLHFRCITLPCCFSYSMEHRKKSVRIWSFSDLYFPTFGLNTVRYGLNTERYRLSLRIQSKCGKIQTIKTPNPDTFHAVELTVFMGQSIQQ